MIQRGEASPYGLSASQVRGRGQQVSYSAERTNISGLLSKGIWAWKGRTAFKMEGQIRVQKGLHQTRTQRPGVKRLNPEPVILNAVPPSIPEVKLNIQGPRTY